MVYILGITTITLFIYLLYYKKQLNQYKQLYNKYYNIHQKNKKQQVINKTKQDTKALDKYLYIINQLKSYGLNDTQITKALEQYHKKD